VQFTKKSLERLSATNTRRLVNPVICKMISTLLNDTLLS